MASVSFDKMGLRNGQQENFNNQDYVLGDYKVKLVCETSAFYDALFHRDNTIKIMRHLLWTRELKWKYQLIFFVSALE